MKERREYIRLSDSLQISYKVVAMPAGDTGSTSKNIGGGGICFPTKHNLSNGDILQLEVHLPQLIESITATAEVVWVRPKTDMQKDRDFLYIVGIHFTEIDPLNRGKIINYVRQRIVEGEQEEVKWID
jgi:c-di-GMP-binding flagellar brake protein YcgR